jgi:hypothetical protein
VLSQWAKHYGPTPDIGIYTKWPELITDSKNSWNIKFLGNFDGIRTVDDPKFHRWTVRVHDRHFDLDYPHCLYIKDPVPIDLSVLKLFMDLKHSVYLDVNEHFALYRRHPEYNIIPVDLTLKPRSGVIFIDCWEKLLTYNWKFSKNYSNPDLNFYQNMIEVLNNYHIDSYVFCHGHLPMTHYLYDWAHGFSGAIRSYNFNFVDYYQSVGIDHWIVVGAHWQQCIHNQAIGFKNLRSLIVNDPKLSIYSIPECTAKFMYSNDSLDEVNSTLLEEDYTKDTLNWKYTDALAKLLV